MTAASPDPLVLFGGTFDPVHFGHLRVAADVRTALAVPRVMLVPAADPAHRPPPGAPAADRVAMLELAIDGDACIGLELAEIRRGGTSYTVDTLRELRAQWPARPLAWVVGADAFLGLPTWHQWRMVLTLAHLIVVARPGVVLSESLHGELAELWNARATTDLGALRHPAGAILRVHTSPNAISATAIRAALAQQPRDDAALIRLLPQAVLTYIESHQLYGAAADAR
ncbi:MAG: nicotinate-nucleotide adenylyltransferase [Casimicrobiaceae bacterium]